MNHYPDLPDTHVYLSDLPAPCPRPGYGACGCNPSYGQSCSACDGTDTELRELRRDPALWAAAVSWTYEQWAAEARGRAEQAETRGSAA